MLQLEWSARYDHFDGDPPKKCLGDDDASVDKCLFDTSLTTAIKVCVNIYMCIYVFMHLSIGLAEQRFAHVITSEGGMEFSTR